MEEQKRCATRDNFSEKEEKVGQQNELSSLEAQLKELQRIHKGYLEAIRANELKRNRVEFEMDNFTAQLEENYQLTFEEAEEEAQAIEDEEFVRRRVKLLKKSIEELGPVNLGAIEEYERVLERHTFLTEQREDLLAAQETLHEAIKEMDEEMTMRFSETFYAIREQFKRVFRELFGGGQADLVLIDPQNLLETGIDIVAQPPGKKLQNLSLLSGGERALTAIALLFSILNIRPVPFCILDEVEAALDEANVVRYSQYLKKFSGETQFIVITHRKGTMEGADVLYGITMQESGVSKLVSVKLEDEPVLAEQGANKDELFKRIKDKLMGNPADEEKLEAIEHDLDSHPQELEEGGEPATTETVVEEPSEQFSPIEDTTESEQSSDIEGTKDLEPPSPIEEEEQLEVQIIEEQPTEEKKPSAWSITQKFKAGLEKHVIPLHQK